MPKTRFFQEFKQGLPDATGKVFVITGTTSGTGLVAARTVAELGGEAVLLNRSSKRVDAMLRSLKEAVPDGKFVAIECDLQNFDTVRRAANEIKSGYDAIYCLANNAGIMATPDEATVDGYDTQMQTNHLSHFLLTAELFPLLEAEAEANGDARIVNHSSFGRLHTPNDRLEEKYFGKNGGNLGGNDIGMMKGGCFYRYFQTKLANSVFTYGLAEKLEASNSQVRAICAHPGSSDTNLLAQMELGFFMTWMTKVMAPFMMQTAEDGAMGLITGMFMPDAQSGVLYGPKDNGTKGKAVPVPPKPFETDLGNIDLLWRTSEEATQTRLLT
ncbi:MAG: SDR family NAD(P)-dependent oxidoreductase [Pseudomonadales bacterium]|jgi:NAD(P)-dependent dehydrogenase (short-subunit alcohol dehydrogenase family)|nr:SDR family NAD(P)-dependent oxidoreductase [Pseudomonadales bacterium]